MWIMTLFFYLPASPTNCPLTTCPPPIVRTTAKTTARTTTSTIKTSTAIGGTTARWQFHQHFKSSFLYGINFWSCSLHTIWLHIFLSKEYRCKSCMSNVDENDFKWQFYKPFTITFFVRKNFLKLLSTWSLAL